MQIVQAFAFFNSFTSYSRESVSSVSSSHRPLCHVDQRLSLKRIENALSLKKSCEFNLRMRSDDELEPCESDYKLRIASSILEIDPAEWNSLARCGSACPFLEHDWLRCIEQSGCASSQSGWVPQHLVLRCNKSDELLAAAPAYIKMNSNGEFCFDHAWAEAAYSLGINYYPKVLVGIPFTPATGRRVLTKDNIDRAKLIKIVAASLVEFCELMKLSSVHVNFCEEDEAVEFQSKKFMKRLGIQYHWQNKSSDAGNDRGELPFRSFDEFLNGFKSKARIKLKRERRRVSEHGIAMSVLSGFQISDEHVHAMFHVYKSTIDKQSIWGRQYLNEAFFDLLAKSKSFRRFLCFVLAHDADGGLAAGTFNVCGGRDNVFYGRYWGCLRNDDAQVPNLHFETCYYSAIEHCISSGISRIEPGSGGGDFKWARGFDAVPTISMHYISDRFLRSAIESFLFLERDHVSTAVSSLEQGRKSRMPQNEPRPNKV